VRAVHLLPLILVAIAMPARAATFCGPLDGPDCVPEVCSVLDPRTCVPDENYPFCGYLRVTI
jgi:hypothetical protein